MNSSQKIIVSVVGCIGLFVIGLILYLNFMKPDKETKVKSNELLFDVPESKSSDLTSLSKLEHYESIISEDLKKEEEKIDFGLVSNKENENIDSILQILRESYGDKHDIDFSSAQEDSNFNEFNQIDSEFDEQDHSSFIDQNQLNESYDSIYKQNEDLDVLLNSLKIISNNNEKEEILKHEEKADSTVVQIPNEYETNLDSLQQNSFYGKNNPNEFSSNLKENSLKEFILAEFYRNTIIKQGDIVEIRLLEDVEVFENFTLSKGTVLYGIASISPRRLFVQLTTNIYKKRSITKSLLIHDYDGREGVYLKEQGLYKVPAEITQEITEIIKSQYYQPSFGGINNNVDIEKIAQVSAYDKIFRQINQLSVNVKGGYKLWIKI